MQVLINSHLIKKVLKDKGEKVCGLTFRSGLNVVAKYWSTAGLAVAPAQPDGGESLGECEVPRPLWRPSLGPGLHHSTGGRTVSDSLGLHGEVVGDSLLQVVDVHEVLRDSLLHLLGVVCNKYLSLVYDPGEKLYDLLSSCLAVS